MLPSDGVAEAVWVWEILDVEAKFEKNCRAWLQKGGRNHEQLVFGLRHDGQHDTRQNGRVMFICIYETNLLFIQIHAH